MIVKHDMGNPIEDNTIEFDMQKYQLLRKKYDRAVKMGYKIFMFEKKEVVTEYARYLLEYLSTKFRE